LNCFVPIAANQLFGHAAQPHSNSSQEKLRAENQPFMIISGITALTEMCLAVTSVDINDENAAIGLIPCNAAVAAGDGREIFSMQSNGQLLHVFRKQCVGFPNHDAVDGGRLGLVRCDTPSQNGNVLTGFEFQGNGQISMDGDHCLSHSGDAVDQVNVASHAAASATSTANALTHGAGMAVDGNELSFWASRLITQNDAVEFLVDWGKAEHINGMKILWEFAPKSFSVLLADANSKWKEILETNVNIISVTRIQLNVLASKAKVLMKELQPFNGDLRKQIYGIKSISFLARPLRTIVDTCTQASKSKDARDKFFLSHVKAFDPEASKLFRAELPVMHAASASLSAAASELSAVLPKLRRCSAPVQFTSNSKSNGRVNITKHVRMASATQHGLNELGYVAQRGVSHSITATTLQEVGADFSSAVQVLDAARAAIIEVRASLKYI